jgi:hypothetical protein
MRDGRSLAGHIKVQFNVRPEVNRIIDLGDHDEAGSFALIWIQLTCFLDGSVATMQSKAAVFDNRMN